MGYARYIGRIGALALTLGVGVAIANTPGIALADDTGSTTGDSASSNTSSTGSSTGTGAAPSGASSGSVANGAPTGGTIGNPSSGIGSPSETDDGANLDTGDLDGDDLSDDLGDLDDLDDLDDLGDGDPDTNGIGNGEVESGAGGDEEMLPPAGGDDSPPAETLTGQGKAAARGSSLRDLSGGSNADVSTFSTFSNNVASALDSQALESKEPQFRSFNMFIPEAPTDIGSFASPLTTTAATTRTALVTTPVERPQPAWVSVVRDFIDAVLQSMQDQRDGSPLGIPALTGALLLVRNELERSLVPQTTNAAAQQGVSQLEDPPAADIVATDTHVLVIAIDGANLSRILADPENENFRELMLGSTTGPSSIVGHTTISNPSWSAILTGNWGEETGVINNVFTPWTYDEYPTVFNQIEQLEEGDEDIVTMAVANWDVINAIAAAGSDPADHNIYVGHEEDDVYWEESDDYVAELTIDAISGAEGPDANFIVAYFVGVDENGHAYGGGSDEYRDSLRNMDDNLGDIMQAIDESGEEWTVIVVTDHGHKTAKGLGHGFQTPDETETFVIAHGSDFTPGYINTQYEIVDTTPTVVALFGGEPRSNADGTPLMDLDAYSVPPEGDLFEALQAEIAKNQSPDPLTNMRLTMRTIFTTVPYYLRLFGDNITQSLPSALAGPVQQTLDAVYVGINIPVQIVAKLTGVEGASTFPRVAPPRPDFQPVYPPTLLLVRCGDTGSSAAASCGNAIVA